MASSTKGEQKEFGNLQGKSLSRRKWVLWKRKFEDSAKK
ncbi:hypothetical protein MNB_SUP05-SYMBIONT-5-539 [hydrothermal vent metagenome]|uniref:Uncharacterized protein n=1 Tax=hydrothermal vent metagenome TaxID=652676 RepID=A0A1W1E229_9ZZZZ